MERFTKKMSLFVLAGLLYGSSAICMEKNDKVGLVVYKAHGNTKILRISKESTNISKELKKLFEEEKNFILFFDTTGLKPDNLNPDYELLKKLRGIFKEIIMTCSKNNQLGSIAGFIFNCGGEFLNNDMTFAFALFPTNVRTLVCDNREARAAYGNIVGSSEKSKNVNQTKEFLETHSNLIELHMYKLSKMPDSLSKMENLTILTIDNMKNHISTSEEFCKIISGCKNLMLLDFNNSFDEQINKGGKLMGEKSKIIKTIKNFKKLVWINLSPINLSPNEIRNLFEMKNLKGIFVGSIRGGLVNLPDKFNSIPEMLKLIDNINKNVEIFRKREDIEVTNQNLEENRNRYSKMLKKQYEE